MSRHEKIAHLQEFPPETAQPNIYPLSWPTGTVKMEEIYQAAQKELWDPAQLPWRDFKPEHYSWEEREAIGYWWTLLSVFDASAPPVFASALIKAYSDHEEDVVRRCFMSITRDEGIHEQMCRRSIEAMLGHNDPLTYEPRTELGKRLQKNVRWLFYNGGRYWEGFQIALPQYNLAVLFSSFLMGEIAAATIFHQLATACTEPVFQDAFRKIGRDEGRHMGICLTLMERDYPQLAKEDHALITKQIRAGYLFLSCVLFEPPADFWDLPEDFIGNQLEAEEMCRQAGFGVPEPELKKKVWRRAMLNLKGILDRYGIPFPALPEVDITGHEVNDVDFNDIVPVF